MSALTIIQGFNNVTLQALSDSELSAALALAALEVAEGAYGAMADHAVANLAAHDLICEAGTASASDNGQTIAEKQIGKMRVRYSSYYQQASSKADPRTDEGLDRTIYGQRFKRMRNQVAVGCVSAGTQF
jgi:hypothetical protein